MDSTVEQYILKHPNWQEGLILLHETATALNFEVAIKWGAPVYMAGGRNVLGLGAFKNHFALWFFDGALLADKNGLLVSAQDNTKALRQWRFTDVTSLPLKQVEAYMLEAKHNAEQGKVVKKQKPPKKFKLSSLLEDVLNDNTDLKKAFKALTAYKQREYSNYVDEAKQDSTKQRRLDKIIPMITLGKGLHDKYKDC